MQVSSMFRYIDLEYQKKHLRVKNGSTLEAEQEEQDTCFMALFALYTTYVYVR